MTTIGELRLRQDISQSTLAERAGLSAATISQAELGRPVQRGTAQKIADALGVKLEELTGITYHSAVRSASKRRRSQTEKPR